MRKFFQTKKMMSFVCVLFTAILSLCSINIINYHDLLTTSSQEEVYTSNENDNTINNEENNSQNDNNETNKSGSDITPPQNTDNTTEASEDENNNGADVFPTAAGDSESNPIEISSAGDLVYLDDGKYYKLVNNIDLSTFSNFNYLPTIGSSNSFYLDGNGYTIYNFNQSGSAAGTNGFIGQVRVSFGNEVVIKNLTLKGNINLSGGARATSKTGGFIGECVIIGSGSVKIENCVNMVNVNVTNTAHNAYVGGFVGYSEATDSDRRNLEITECMNFGTIKGGSQDSNSVVYVGGLVGAAYDNVYIGNCLNSGEVKNFLGKGFAGGIMGWTGAEGCDGDDVGKTMYIYKCVNTVRIRTNYNYQFSGIVGGVGKSRKGDVCDNAGHEDSHFLFADNDFEFGYIQYCVTTNDAIVGTNFGNGAQPGNCVIQNCYYVGGYIFDGLRYPLLRNMNDGNLISPPGSVITTGEAYTGSVYPTSFQWDYDEAMEDLPFSIGTNPMTSTWTNIAYNSFEGITEPYLILDFLKMVRINVCYEKEDGSYLYDRDELKALGLGYETPCVSYDKHEHQSWDYYAFTKSAQYYGDVISNVIGGEGANSKYTYMGIYSDSYFEDFGELITSERYLMGSAYDIPSEIYIRFDLNGSDEPEPVPEPEPDPELPINFRVYYTERIGFNGNLPSDLHLDSARMGGSVVTEIGGVKQTSNRGYVGYSKVKYQASVAITAIPEAEFELCGIYAGDVGENPYECINLAEFMLKETYKININFPADLSFSQVKYSFNNEIYDDEGCLVTEFSIVFSRYQYTGISFTQTFETDRFDEPYEYEVTTNFIYGYLKRTLNLDGLNVFGDRDNLEPRFYPVDEDGNISDIYETNYQLDFRDQDLNFNFFDGDGSHYVGELLTPTYGITNPTSASKLGFYWLWGANDTQEENTFYFRRHTGDTQFSNNRKIIEGRGLTAVPANTKFGYPPYFTINLYNYFMIGNAFDDYGNFSPTSAYLSGPGFNYIDFRVNDGESAFMAGSVSFKEYSDPSQQQNFNLYFLNMYEDMASVETFFGDEGGKFEVSSLGGLDVEKTNFKIEDGKIVPMDSETGTEVEGYAVLNIGLRFTYKFVYSIDEPFESYYDTEGDDVILNEEDKKLIMETPITDLFKFIKTPNYLYHDFFGDRNTLFNDFGTYAGIDLSEYTIYDLALKMLEDDEENATYQNMENGNILLYNYFEVNRFRIVVGLDDEYSFDIDSVLSFYVNDMKYPQSSAEQYAIGNIKAYSEIELEIEDSVIYDSRLGRYTVYAYNNITSGGVQMTNQDSWHFQVIPENNGRNIIFTVNLDEVFSMTSSDFSSSSIQRVGNMWYIDEARDFYYLYYLNAFAGEDFEGIRLIQTANIDFGGDLIMPLGTSSTPFRGVYDGQYYTIQNFEINFSSGTEVGFFGYVESAEIKNVTLLDGEVSGFDNVGGVVGCATNSTLTRLGNYSVKVSGGGENIASNNIFVITTTGQFTPLSYANLDMFVQKGLSEDLLLKNSSGGIDFTTYPTYSATSMGGFAGYLNLSTLNTCFSRGEVDSDATYSGGFVGSADGSSLSYCYTRLNTFGGVLRNTTVSHWHVTNGKDIDDVCSTCADRFIW